MQVLCMYGRGLWRHPTWQQGNVGTVVVFWCMFRGTGAEAILH